MGCFGRTGGSSSDTETFSKGQAESKMMSASQRKYFEKLLNLVGGTIGETYVYPGDRVADFTDSQNDILDLSGNFLNLFGNPITAGTPLKDETGQTIKNTLAGNTGAQKTSDQQVMEYFNTKIKDPTLKTLNEDLLPSVDEGYGGGNFFSTARGNARDNVIQDTSDVLTQQLADLQWNTQQSNQALDEARANRMLQAVTPALSYGNVDYNEAIHNLGLAGSQLGGLSDLFNLGSTEQSQEQAEIDAAIQKFAEENQIMDANNLATLIQLLGMNVTQSTKTSNIGTSHTNNYENSWKAGDWGSFATLAGLALI